MSNAKNGRYTLVITNDDGIDAPGLQALRAAAPQLKTIVVAPRDPSSQISHAITTHRPLRIDRREEDVYAVDGTPADCVRVALMHFQPESPFVLSGINAGGNLGADVYVSGTVAAVREAAFLGVPGIAVSQYKRRDLEFDWELAAEWTVPVLADLVARKQTARTFWNVNLPHLAPGTTNPEVVDCAVCREPLPVRYRAEGDALHYTGVYADRSRTPGSDVDLCLNGAIVISELHI